MKTLKITLFLALFLAVSSQTDKTPLKKEANRYEAPKAQYDLLAHSRNGMRIPTQG